MTQRNPLLTPNQVKSLLMRTATKLPGQPGSGAGELNAGAAVNLVTDLLALIDSANGGLTPSKGTGRLEGSRGSLHVYADTNNDGRPDYVSGEITAFGTRWTASAWGANSWSDYAWQTNSWTIDAWGAKSWSGMGWSAKSWSANTWSNGTWSSNAWSAKSWSAKSWSANDWAAKSWSAKSWSAASWN
jgi:serine protease AprX